MSHVDLPLSSSSSIKQRSESERGRSATLNSIDIAFHSVDRNRIGQQHHENDNTLLSTTSSPHSKLGKHQSRPPRPDIKRARSATMSMLQDNTSLNSIQNTESPTWLLSDLLSNLSVFKDKNEYSIVAKANDLVMLFQQHPNLKHDVQIKAVLPRIQFMLNHPTSEVRSSCYRIIRYLIVNYESLMILVQQKLLIYIIISLSNTRNVSLIEMEQSLKLIREFLTVDKGSDLLSVGVIKTLITIVEENGDSSNNGFGNINGINDQDRIITKGIESIPESFKNACLETICEITLLNPELICHSGGFKLIINSILDKPVEIGSTCLMIVLKLLDFENSRKFVRNGFDLDSLISIYSNLSDHDDETNLDNNSTRIRKTSNYKLQKISFLISTLLKNFNGIIAYLINDFTSIKNLLMNLQKKNTKVRESILDLLLDALMIQSFPWLKNSPIGDSIMRYNELFNDGYQFKFEFKPIDDEFSKNILHHHQGLLTLILIKNGIFKHLTQIIEENRGIDIPSRSIEHKRATMLLTNLYAMANNYLPAELIGEKLLLPDLSLCASFEIFNETRHEFRPTPEYNQHVKSSIKQLNIQAKYNIDDNTFKTMVSNSKILAVKEFEDWNWQLLLTLIQGPLGNPKRFDEVLEKVPKFFKRLLSFYRPFKYRFSTVSLTKDKNSFKYINIGCQLIELFLSLDNGIKYLSKSKLLPQISEIVAQIDPFSGITSKDPILSEKRLETTASVGYLRFIGVLSSHSLGIRMLEQWQFFTLFLNIISSSTESETNNLFILTIFKYADFSIDSPFRNTLEMAIRVSNFKIRNYLLKHVLPRLIKTEECRLFIIRILVENLYCIGPSENGNGDGEIVTKSIEILYHYYQEDNFSNLDTLIQYQPLIEVLQKYRLGKKLLNNFLRFPEGFKYLERLGYLEEKFNKLTQAQDFKYLYKINSIIQYQFYPHVFHADNNSNNADNDNNDADDQLSIYFLKNLLSTEEGLNFFQFGKGKEFLHSILLSTEIIFQQISQDAKFHDIENQDDEEVKFLINAVKQNLWLIGNLALGEFGIQLLDPMYNNSLNANNNSIINIIIDNFKTCSIWQIRGICFYVLGMIASTIEGIEILDEFNWVSCVDQYGNCKRLSYPKVENLVEIFNIEMSNPYRDTRYYHIFNSIPVEVTEANSNTINNDTGDNIEELAISDNTDKPLVDENGGGGEKEDDQFKISLRRKIIVLITNLQAVLSKIVNKSIRELNKLRSIYPEIFNSDTELFLEIMKLIDKANFSYHQRSFILNLFLNKDTKILENLNKK